MTASDDERNALVAQRGLAVLLIGGGLLLGWNGLQGESLFARSGLGALMLAVGVGIFFYWRWARWMALGACFLIIASACVVPVMLLLIVPFEGEFDGSMRVNVLWSVVALAFGTIGYKGLAYFRSEAGRLEFAAEDATAQQDLFNVAAPDRKDDLLGETSATVLLSAGVWVLVVLVAEVLGLGKPDWLLAHKRPERHVVAPSAPAERDVFWYEVSRDPTSLAGYSSQAARNRVLPDLVPLGVCRRDIAVGPVLEMVYANAGLGSGYQTFHFGTRQRTADSPTPVDGDITVPEPDSLLTMRLTGNVPTVSGFVWVDLDIRHEISESDETNNSALFTIPYNEDGTPALPACNNVRLRIVSRPGPARTLANAPGPAKLPDLVPLGLCARGNLLIGLEFTNHGAYAPGVYQISQGRSAGNLSVVDPAYLPVPQPYESMGFTLGAIPLLVGKRGSTADITVKIDALDEIHESNKMNNLTSARVTRLADGSVDLLSCDELAKHVDDPDWVKPEVEKPAMTSRPAAVRQSPATTSLPDLVALGGCMSSHGGFMVAFGNRGGAAPAGRFQILAEMAGGSLSGGVGPESFWPGGVYLQYLNVEPRLGKGLVLKIDTLKQITELDETNNELDYEFQTRADGSIDLPVCNPGMSRITDWDAMMRARKGS